MVHNNFETMIISFNSPYYLAKNKRLFSIIPISSNSNKKHDVLKFTSYLIDRSATNFIIVGEMLRNDPTGKVRKCKYIFILSDGITDTAIIEEGIDYLLFLTEQEKPEVKFLKPKVKFLSIESPEFTTPKG